MIKIASVLCLFGLSFGANINLMATPTAQPIGNAPTVVACKFGFIQGSTAGAGAGAGAGIGAGTGAGVGIGVVSNTLTGPGISIRTVGPLIDAQGSTNQLSFTKNPLPGFSYRNDLLRSDRDDRMSIGTRNNYNQWSNRD
jgi:hypothetical protein